VPDTGLHPRIPVLDDVGVTDEVLAAQLDYYRSRAAEYDETAYGDLAAAEARIARLVGELKPTGRVLELACGTGMWTPSLAASADTVTAVDAAPEVIAVARERVNAATVTFEVADIFGWRTQDSFDVVFFAAWLSHVPASRFEEFWRRLRDLLAADGRVLFVDEHVDERGKERYVEGCDEIVERRLADGRVFSVVKNFVEPQRLAAELGRLGWDCTVRRDGVDWVYGDARPAR
jgi:SAM-dependent methyltransferase